MATDAEYIVTQAEELLGDPRGDVYTPTQGLRWVNMAQRALVQVRPDAKSVIDVFTVTTASTRQPLPTSTLNSYKPRRLMQIIRNAGIDGLTFTKAVRGPIPREQLDSLNPDWHGLTGTYVREYTYSDAIPDFFYVVPAIASGTWYLEGAFSLNPVDVALIGDPIDLADIYVPALIEYVTHCFAARDDERTPNWARAHRHFAAFFQLLDVKLQRDLAISPKVLENT